MLTPPYPPFKKWLKSNSFHLVSHKFNFYILVLFYLFILILPHFTSRDSITLKKKEEEGSNSHKWQAIKLDGVQNLRKIMVLNKKDIIVLSKHYHIKITKKTT